MSGDEVEFPGGKVTATPFLGEHCDLDIRAKSTYCVQMAGRTIFVGADSAGLDPAILHQATAALNLNASLKIEKVDRSGISATKVQVYEGANLVYSRDEEP